jgi:surface-anchored protein
MINATALFARLTGPRQSTRKKTCHKACPLLEPLEERTLLDNKIVLTNEHTDLDVTYSGTDGRMHLAENNKSVFPTAYYPAVEDDKAMRGDVPVILEFLPEARRPQTSDPRFAFTGAAPGDPIWIVPISPRDPRLLQLGVSGERIDTDTLGEYKETDPRINNFIPLPWIRLTIVDVRGPGYFSVWQTSDTGSPTVWVATAGNPNPDLFFTIPGGHVDYNWAFTQPGDYEVDIRASAFLPDLTLVQSYVTTYHFQVDDAGSAPVGTLTALGSQEATFALFTGAHSTAANPGLVALVANLGAPSFSPWLAPSAVDQVFAPHQEGREFALPHFAQPAAAGAGSQVDSLVNLFSVASALG